MIGQNSLQNHGTTFIFCIPPRAVWKLLAEYTWFSSHQRIYSAQADNGTYKNKGFAEATWCTSVTCALHMATEPSGMYVDRVCHSPSSVIWGATLFVFYEDIGS